MKDSFMYFDLYYALKVHDIVIRESGGLPGVKDEGAVESIIEHIKNDIYYPYFEDKITHLVFSFIKHHTFNDGNKRSSIALGAYFLEINGLDFCVIKFIYELENIVVYVAENKISKDLLKEIIISIISEDDYSEELKLKIIHSIS
ncbi:MAG: death-on-curing family protein [Rickettsiaceae bacterium]|jgi:death-on-curing protein|nr:death-on-curing family protein [Rickettsiaceae bacterium]